jgi:hypothetical protein
MFFTADGRAPMTLCCETDLATVVCLVRRGPSPALDFPENGDLYSSHSRLGRWRLDWPVHSDFRIHGLSRESGSKMGFVTLDTDKTLSFFLPSAGGVICSFAHVVVARKRGYGQTQ